MLQPFCQSGLVGLSQALCSLSQVLWLGRLCVKSFQRQLLKASGAYKVRLQSTGASIAPHVKVPRGICAVTHDQSHTCLSKLFFKVRVFRHEQSGTRLVVYANPKQRKVQPNVVRVRLSGCRVLFRKLGLQRLLKLRKSAFSRLG